MINIFDCSVAGADPDILNMRGASRGSSEKGRGMPFFLLIIHMKMTNFPIKGDANPCTSSGSATGVWYMFTYDELTF